MSLKYSNYCMSNINFPAQQDSHNCGAYICLIAKCILQNRILRLQSHEALRETVFYELATNTLIT